MQKARGHPGVKTGLPLIVGAWFQVLFTPLPAVLFTFPSRYWCAIGLPVVFSLAGWCRRVQAGFLRPRPTQGTGRRAPRARTGLSPSAAAFSKRLPLGGARFVPALQPPAARSGVWARPLSLATTRGITVVLLSSGYLDVSVPRVAVPAQGRHAAPSARRVAPFGHLRIKGCLRLPAAFRSLPRPSSSLGAKASPMRPCSLPFLDGPGTLAPGAGGSAAPRGAGPARRPFCLSCSPNLVNELLYQRAATTCGPAAVQARQGRTHQTPPAAACP